MSVLRRFAVLLTALACASLIVVSPTPAQAATKKRDPHDAPWAIDTRLVRLYQNWKGTVTVQMFSDTYNAGKKFNGLDVYYDTSGNNKADYRVHWGFTKDGDGYSDFGLFKVKGTKILKRVRCPGLSAKGRKKVRNIEVYVPRSCMKIKKRVRIYTLTWDYTKYRKGQPKRGRSDRAPNRGMLR